jgi:hypothetical protein
MRNCITPFSLKDAPALIERLLPVQKLSAESYKEQEARQSKTLTALGSYWKGRKPLILNKACILGCLLLATDDLARDLEIFEKLMAMDDESFVARWKRRPRPKEILAALSIACISDSFTVEPEGVLPDSAPVDWSRLEYTTGKVAWRADCSELERRLEAQMLSKAPYRKRLDQAQRPEEVMDTVHDHVWDTVKNHLGTIAHSFSELVEQLGIMRFGHRPRVADAFCGSGQIPFEAVRLGCDVYASDLSAVDTANQCLVPPGIAKVHWDGLTGAERFYLKLIDLEARGLKTLDNYQNFAKAFKGRDLRAFMASQKANQARLKSAVEFGKTEMSDSSELHHSVLRAILYAMMELMQNVDGHEVLAHLTLNVPAYYANQTQRDRVVELADYLARKLETRRPDEASAARILRELVRHQRLG